MNKLFHLYNFESEHDQLINIHKVNLLILNYLHILQTLSFSNFYLPTFLKLKFINNAVKYCIEYSERLSFSFFNKFIIISIISNFIIII